VFRLDYIEYSLADYQSMNSSIHFHAISDRQPCGARSVPWQDFAKLQTCAPICMHA
jgi:hypothetical protein